MVRSFHYAVFGALFHHATVRPEDKTFLKKWIKPWYHYVSGVFLTSYLETAGDASFIPDTAEDISTLLNAFLLDKAIYELEYEMNNRPDWALIPLNGILDVLQASHKNSRE